MNARPMLASADAIQTAAPETPAENEFTIGDLAREFGVTLRTLRFYEHRGLLKPRRQGLARFYDEKAKARLALILKGKQLGFTLPEIRAMLAANDRGAAADLGSNI
jgi:DNA-binding transcriptional MerR regulator